MSKPMGMQLVEDREERLAQELGMSYVLFWCTFLANKLLAYILRVGQLVYTLLAAAFNKLVALNAIQESVL